MKLNAEEPGQCGCWDLTMVGYSDDAYWESNGDGEPTGHHPQCELYVRPPPDKSLAAQLAARRPVVRALLEEWLNEHPRCSSCGVPATNQARYRYGCDAHREWQHDLAEADLVRRTQRALGLKPPGRPPGAASR